MDIAIVGGGAAAVGLLDTLATHPTHATGVTDAAVGRVDTITVFEPSPHLWRGRPYGPDLAAVLVNTPPALMSVRAEDRDHFAAWLGQRVADHLDPLLGQPLVPRALYGEYLVHSAEKAVAALDEQGHPVRVVRARVREVVVNTGARLVLRTDDGLEYAADRVALCVGGGTPPDPYGLAGAPGFTADPYPLADSLDAVAASDDVTVLGSGLTAVDVVVALAARGYQGRISLLSRGGVLPYVWQRPTGRRPTHVTVERVAELRDTRGQLALTDLAGLLRAEMAEAGEDFDALAAHLRATRTDDPVARLRQQLAEVGDARIGRRVLQETAHSVGPYAWRLLREPDRAWLRRHLRTAASVVSPMVPVNASVLLRLLDSGQLTISSGVRAVEPVNGRFRIRDAAGERTASALVNAVNAAPQAVPAGARDLAHSLTHAGLATPHPAGGLVPTDPRLHVVGDLAGGGPFLTSSIAGVAAQAARVAGVLGER
ncbi:FAD/NAD(P)-binding protein [Streptomyces sp. 71268]|uniref:FAD/NAD(P)-binding protein n=1 Tax=Streptomyces sp. 71268 TaxID=3002640 RepID=UPI0023F6A6A1|nr:FAD/NAD(P)-binding protein [Streptomyces sp. 71268]WEV26217.1 FAD/NAD(P)-binding protein [Streptomyces sp. 71268]